MKKYMNLFDSIEKINLINDVDISNAEEMLHFYMEKYQIRINTFIDNNIKYELLR